MHLDLVYDVGMHRGEDTNLYLKKGFRVVGFEADPQLAAFCRDRFRDEMATGRLLIVEGAIVPRTWLHGNRYAKIPFIRNLTKSEWGTIDPGFAARPQNCRTGTQIVLTDAIDFDAQLTTHGMPYYLKIDIEGADRVCLEALKHFSERPRYISIESEKRDFGALVREMRLLRQLGYKKFQLVQQAYVQRQKEPRPAREGRYVGQPLVPGSSGLFGDDLPDRWTDCRSALRAYRRVFHLYRLFGDNSLIRRFKAGRYVLGLLRTISGIELPGWYDTHAVRE